MREPYDVSYRITGIASRRLGWIADANGLDATALLGLNSDSIPALPVTRPLRMPAMSVLGWRPLGLTSCSKLFPQRGQRPASGRSYSCRARARTHAITANKGPIVYAHRELRDLAAARGKGSLFESTVMDGVPIFSLFDQMPAIHLQGFHGILNSTTNVILGEMEQGLSFDEALKKAQALGVAETDATHDIDGWDAAVKTAALITVLMDVPIRLDQIARDGIRDLTPQALRTAKRDGWAFKLVCRARRTANGVEASVALRKFRARSRWRASTARRPTCTSKRISSRDLR